MLVEIMPYPDDIDDAGDLLYSAIDCDTAIRVLQQCKLDKQYFKLDAGDNEYINFPEYNNLAWKSMYEH